MSAVCGSSFSSESTVSIESLLRALAREPWAKEMSARKLYLGGNRTNLK